jgi:hypothetical protein
MAKQQKPKKPAKPKKLNLTVKQRWRAILAEVDKQEIPVHVLERLVVHLKDGTDVEVNIKELIAEGNDPVLVEQHINSRLDSLDDIIDNVDFFVDVDSVVRTIQPETDRLLANLAL